MKAYIKNAWYYCKRNGISRTFFTAMERMLLKDNKCYEWKDLPQEELEKQRQRVFRNAITFSILVPAYETDSNFLCQMMDSLLNQTYPHWELVIADASKTDAVENIVRDYTVRQQENRIVYKRLENNAGISANTNEALKLATGEYIGLLDHDDVLTPDALYEMAVQIESAKKQGKAVKMLYSDEDKCDMDMTHFYEPHFKEEFNLDLILSNNYICHFLVMEAGLMKQVQFQTEFDGAQDYKLVLDAVTVLMRDTENTLQKTGVDNNVNSTCYNNTWFEKSIVHIPKVLYHWRCHTGSTAQNPQSKLYAYDAGKHAVASFCEKHGWRNVTVEHLPHLGFYKIVYGNGQDKSNGNVTKETVAANIFAVRKDVGAVGGAVLHHGRIVGGRYRQDGYIYYQGLFHRFSGYMHRAVLMQEAEALDVRCIVVREELQATWQEIRAKYNLPEHITEKVPEKQFRQAGLELAEVLHKQGYRMVWNPAIKCKI
ncbi:MAG: glycosyltransferase [Lachnospiraceae bacterium]|nr:glycosyltransferase [Lachnospiraceae bacterium]